MNVIESVALDRAAFVALGELFRYPYGPLGRRIADARAACHGAASVLDDFERETAAVDSGQLQSVYTSTFDLAPSCSPYLGAHVFGDESRDRARFMIGLRERYAAEGENVTAELPDHVAVVLGFAPRFEDEEWSDLVRLVLGPALEKMDALVASTKNPYRHLVAATLQVTRDEMRNVTVTGGEA